MRPKVTKSCGNIFQDIGCDNANHLFARSKVMIRIVQILQERGLTQREAGKVLNLPQSKISSLINGKLNQFSLDHLFQILNLLDKDIEIIIKNKLEHEITATTNVLLAV